MLLFQGEADGWTHALEAPEAWCPGCIAMPDGPGYAIHVAVGGNKQAGATAWQACEPNRMLQVEKPVPVTITATFTDPDEAWALAQFLKRVTLETAKHHAAGRREAVEMIAGLGVVEQSLRAAGCAPC